MEIWFEVVDPPWLKPLKWLTLQLHLLCIFMSFIVISLGKLYMYLLQDFMRQCTHNREQNVSIKREKTRGNIREIARIFSWRANLLPIL